MFDDLLEYLRGLPWKDWAGPIITGMFAVGVGGMSWAIKVWDGRENRRAAREKAERDREHTLDLAQTQDLTARFRALMDGYEARIKDVSAELISAKAEIRENRIEIDRLRSEINNLRALHAS